MLPVRDHRHGRKESPAGISYPADEGRILSRVFRRRSPLKSMDVAAIVPSGAIKKTVGMPQISKVLAIGPP